MLSFVFLFWLISLQGAVKSDPASDQVIFYKERHAISIDLMTTGAGAPIPNRDTQTVNKRLIVNEYFMDSLTHVVRERIPERVVHAIGSGAFGYFEVTENVTDIFRSKLFSKVGKRTPIVVRFSPSALERGGLDTYRDFRGFAVKFYTEEGNFDIAGLNTPMYAYKDPLLFISLNRVRAKNPATNLIDSNRLWDYLTLRPENLHMFLLIFGDRGIPDGYRHMPGFGIHTFQVVNSKSENHFVRFHFTPDAGIKSLTSEKAKKIGVKDPDYATRDLYNAIASGNFPSWTIYIQVLNEQDVKTAGFDVFDVTKTLSIKKYPLRLVGRFILNRNPLNYFAEIEQLAFCPANLVPGILGAPDKLFEARRLVYRDAQYYRLGANFLNIPVNCPYRTKVFNYNRDGNPPVNENQKDAINYYPNSFNGATTDKNNNTKELINIYEEDADNFEQARDVYLYEMTSGEKRRLVENTVCSLSGVAKFLQDRVVEIYKFIHPDLSRRIYEELLSNNTVC